jgi:phage baseplate assembly protein W
MIPCTAPFLGSGWAFPVARDEPGTDSPFARASFEDSVRQGMLLVLQTAPGERLMRPDFGCAIHRLLFAPNDATTSGLAESAVREALQRWEPRIELLRVTALPGGDREELLVVNVDYRVRRTDSRFNLVYPFYLARPSR